MQRGDGQFSVLPDRFAGSLPSSDHYDSSAEATNRAGVERLNGASRVLEDQGRAVIGLNSQAMVTYVSRLAATYCGDAFDIVGGHIRIRNQAQRPAFERLVNSVTGGTGLILDLRSIPVARGNGKLALVAYGCRLPHSDVQVFAPVAGLLVFVDPEKPRTIPAELLMDYFGFTRTEARLAISILNGVSLDQHATENGVSVVTARNQLQSLQSKTGRHSKADLVALLSRVVPF